MARLGLTLMSAEDVGRVPERWRHIAYERGLLKRSADGGYVQRAPTALDADAISIEQVA